MNRRKIVASITLMTVLLLSLASSLTVAAETHRVLRFTEEGLRVKVYAPYQAYPGDRITIKVSVEALEDLDDVTITIYIFGSKSEEGKVGYDSWEDDIEVLEGEDMDEGDDVDEDYRRRMPSDSDPGLVYGYSP